MIKSGKDSDNTLDNTLDTKKIRSFEQYLGVWVQHGNTPTMLTTFLSIISMICIL